MRFRILRRLTPCLLSLAALASPGRGAPPWAVGSTPLQLRAPAPGFRAIEGTGMMVPGIEGFGASTRPGQPMLPLRVVRVAIPEGTIPELRVISSRRNELGSMRLAPVPRGRVEKRSNSPADQKAEAEYDEDASVFGRDADFPGEPVRLGSIGYLREQRFVEVIYSPLQYNPVGHRVAWFPEVQADLLFTQAPGAPPAESFGPAPADPFFEETYKRTLINYEQGRLFRVAAGSSAALQTPEAAAALTTAAAAGAPRYKIGVASEGIHRLTYADLQGAAPDLLLVDPRTWSLSVDGTEVPMSIRTASGGPADDHATFLQTDTLEFYGRPKSEPPTTVNFSQIGFPTIYQANDFTDTQVYWLTSGGTAGSHLRIPEAPGNPVNGFVAATDFEQAAVWDDNSIYLPLDGVDPFFSIPSLVAGGAQAQRDLALPLPGLTTTAIPPSVTLRVRGGTSLANVALDHDTRIWLNGDTAGTREFQWDGETIFQTTFTVSPSVPTNPTTIHVLVPVVTGVSVDQQFLDTVTIKYRRTFTAASDALLFSYPNQDVRFVVSGLSGPPPAIYEVTRSIAGLGEASPTRITGAGSVGSTSVTATFEVARDASAGAPATRTFMVVGPQGYLRPQSFQQATAPTLQDPANAADIIVIGTPDTIDPSPGGALQSLLAYRLAHQGLTSKVVMMSQIYDEFSFGRRDATAIRSFLGYAFNNWKGTSGVERPPSFVLLVGDATPDYKHTLLNEPAWVDQVPTPMMLYSNSILGYYSSDNWLAAFRGADQLPDVHLGRISTRTAADSAAVFAKILQYQSSPPSGLWKGRIVLSASEGRDASESADFEGVGNQIGSLFFSSPPYSISSPLLYFGEPPYNGTDTTAFKRDFTSALTNGGAILSYIGHGNFDTWGAYQTIFTTQDALNLTNGPYLPFMVTVNCLTGGFHYFLPGGSIGEGMTNNPNGGSIASLSPSGLSSVLATPPLIDSLYEPMFGAQQERFIGAAADDLRAGLFGQGNIPDMQSFTLLGDPATLLVTPAPAPPTGVVATAGNGTVQLTWIPPSATPAGYRVFRSTAPAGAYSPVTCSPAGASSCTDSSVINATTYYYYVVSLDPDGFEGRASNFNSDCDAGPDCVVARPLNPNPPAIPKGVAVTDPGSGGRLVVSWLANTEVDLKGYTLYYGTLSGQYPFKVNLGPGTTSALLSGLSNGTRYFIALSATNTSLHESPLSTEVSAVPLLFDGIAPPREITDLDVSRSGTDLILTWSRPLLDIYGRPTTVVKYTIYRGTTPGFAPFQTTPLATINDPALTTYSDHGAGAPGPSNLYYLVTATDASGFTSGAGRELPNGIESLVVTRPTSGTVRLAWPAVTTDVSGFDTLIDHYQIYASALPLSRASLGPATLVMDNVRVLTVDLALPSGKQYYSVIAVDNRGNLSPF